MNAVEQPILRKKLSRKEMVKFFEKTPPTTIALEACGGSHHWARLLSSLGHQVKLIAPQLAKPYVKRGKNDAADAEALCEAIDGRTTRHRGHAVSLRIRKRIEEAFGWIKTIAGQDKTRFRGRDRVEWAFTFAAAAYNLVRLPKLIAETG